MLTMFNDAKNFPEYRLFIFIRGCFWLAVSYQTEYLFLNGLYSSIFQGNSKAHIITDVCNKSVSVLQIHLSNTDLWVWIGYISDAVIWTLKYLSWKWNIYPKSQKQNPLVWVLKKYEERRYFFEYILRGMSQSWLFLNRRLVENKTKLGTDQWKEDRWKSEEKER